MCVYKRVLILHDTASVTSSYRAKEEEVECIIKSAHLHTLIIYPYYTLKIWSRSSNMRGGRRAGTHHAKEI